MPLDKVRVFDYFDGFDAHGVKQGNRIPSPDVKDSSDNTADVRANFDDAFHILDFTQTFDGGFDSLSMRFDKVELLLVPGNLLGIAMGIDLHQIVLCNEAQNGDRVRLVTERIKIGPLEVAAEKGRSKVLRDMMHGLVGGQRTESFRHIVWDFVENCSENVDRRDGSDRSGLKENVLHRSVIPLDLPLRHRVIRRTTGLLKSRFFS